MKGDLRYVYVIAHTKKHSTVVSECDECEDGKVVVMNVSLKTATFVREKLAKEPEVVCEKCREGGE